MTLLKGHEARKTSFSINGVLVRAIVTIMVERDSDPEVGDSFDFDDMTLNAEYLARFRRGEVENTVISVIARAEGLEGIDTLGGCHVVATSHDAYVKDVVATVKDNDMVANALAELKTNIIEAAVKLQRFTKGA